MRIKIRLKINCGVKESDGAIHFFLYLTMLNFSSFKSMRLVIILFANSRNAIRISHGLA